MSFFNKLFKRNNDEMKVGGMEDFMTLIRVYLQADIAAQVGITNLAALPDLRLLKQTLKVPTINNKLGLGEKKRCAKMLNEVYGISDTFCSEIDTSVKKRCKRLQDVQPYLIQFQGFSQDLMMLMGNLMKFKLRVPSIFKKTIYAMTEKTVSDIFMKNDYKDPSVIKAVLNVRKLNARLNFSQKWVTDFTYQVMMLAKKEPRLKEEDEKKK